MKSKQTYKFTIVLKNVDENTPDLEDSLYEAGCDDALVNFINGTVYLDFDRKAFSLEDAVISAIKDIETASIPIEVTSVGPENLVTESEIANRLNKKRQTVSLWIRGKRRKSFPHPVMRIAEKSPLWNWHEVIQWLFDKKIINDIKLVDKAAFFANINSVLEERDRKIRKYRQNLLNRIAS